MRISALLLAAALVTSGGPSPDVAFTVVPVADGSSESAAVADIDRDGRLDIVSGGVWYHAPAWTPYRFRDVPADSGYLDSFSLLPIDVDEDGWIDLVDVTWFEKRIAWWRNPGRAWGPAHWVASTIHGCCPVEFAVLADIDGDGRAREIVAQENGVGQAWYEVRNGLWRRHQVSDRSHGHGIGAGDVNGDGRVDIVTPAGWLEAPPDPRQTDWTLHDAWAPLNTPLAGSPTSVASSPLQLGFMHVTDVDDDGRADVLTSAAHGYGVFWFQQHDEGWVRHVIDRAWSQGHASAMGDLDGDGRLDFITGKRFMAHNGRDPGAHDPLGLYWYSHTRSAGRKDAEDSGWRRQAISTGGRVGAGMQTVVVDLDGDGDRDVVVGGKSGLYWLRNEDRQVP